MTDLEQAEALLAKEPPHPFIPLPDARQVVAALQQGEERAAQLQQLLEYRRAGIEESQRDPLRHGFRLDCWKRADDLLGNLCEDAETGRWNFGQNREAVSELYILGGNRSSKSEYAAWLTVQMALAIPGARIWCFQTSEKNSIHMQQERVYHYLPAELKGKLREDGVTKIRYKPATGFTNAIVVYQIPPLIGTFLPAFIIFGLSIFAFKFTR